MTFLRTSSFVATVLAGLLSFTSAHAQKMKTEIPAGILIPDSVETRLGTLKFFDGLPDASTAQKVYDYFDFQNAVEVYLEALPQASFAAMRRGLKSIGADNQTIPIWERPIDSKALFLTADPEEVYVTAWLDLGDGPMVIEVPPGVRLFAYDAAYRDALYWGNNDSDRRVPNGKGGKYLVYTHDYKFAPPPIYTAELDSDSHGVWWGLRAIPGNNDRQKVIESIRKHVRVYSAVHKEKRPPQMRFVNASGLTINTLHANDYRFYEEIVAFAKTDMRDVWYPDLAGRLESIGIFIDPFVEKPFAPDDRTKKILTEAASVGNAIVRTVVYRPRDQEDYMYSGKSWRNPDTSWKFLATGLDAWVRKFYLTTDRTHAADERSRLAVDSQRIFTSFDADKNYFDGSKSYKLHLPPNIPAKASWSVVLYDTQTRSELQTDQQFPSTGSRNPALKANADGSYDLYFSPTAPAGMEGNWVQTLPEKSWFVILRVNDPLEPWYKKEWQPDDVVLIK